MPGDEVNLNLNRFEMVGLINLVEKQLERVGNRPSSAFWAQIEQKLILWSFGCEKPENVKIKFIVE
jgi:hypothetical protein